MTLQSLDIGRALGALSGLAVQLRRSPLALGNDVKGNGSYCAFATPVAGKKVLDDPLVLTLTGGAASTSRYNPGVRPK
jgi:hypothetical protein